jgi:hypothetical protein
MMQWSEMRPAGSTFTPENVAGFPDASKSSTFGFGS